MLGKLRSRPRFELARQATPELVRGMKVRSSVKKLCDGCKVRVGVLHTCDDALKLTGDFVHRALRGKATSISYARRIRSISSGKGDRIRHIG